MVFPIKCLEDYHLYHESLDDTNKDYHEHKKQVLLDKAVNY